jgi:uncharacterized protein YegJ (DUF2314 family)
MALLGAALLGLAAPLGAEAQDETVAVAADDPEMQAAIRQARAGLPVFFGHATSPGPDEGGFMVKYDLRPDGRAEFIWAEVISHKGDVTLARLLNTPLDVRFAKDQQVSVRDKAVVDWAYWRAGTLVGGATMRVLVARMPPGEARELLDRFGW